MKKKNLTRFAFAILLSACGYLANAQGVSVNTTGNDADPSAMLDVNSTTQGMLVPRMTAAQRGLITTPATGLLVYQTDDVKGFYFYNGTAWVSLNAYTNVTTQGNTFNGNNQLVQTDGSGALPAISGANLTNLNFLPLAGGTMNDGASVVLGSGTGTKIGTGTTQKLGFYGANPVTQQSGDVASALSNLGLVSSPSITATTNAAMTGDVTSVGNTTSYNNKVPLTKGGTNSDLSATGGAGSYLKQTTTGGAVTVGTIAAGDIPILNQNTTGNAATVTTNADMTGDVTSTGNTTSYNNIVPLTKGGTNSDLSATGGAGSYLKQTTTGGAVTVGTIAAGDIPILNQNTTGNAATVTTNADMTGDVTSAGNTTSYNNKVPLTKGGTNSDLSATGGAGSYLKQTTTGGAVTVGTIAAGDIPILNQNTTGNAATVTTNADMTGDVTSTGNTTSYNNKVPLTKGGTNSDLSATGGAGSYLKQTTAGGAVTVGTIAAGDIPILNQNTTGNAATVTTNANLSGPISSSGNTTSVTSQAGTGTKFVMDASPTINSPTLVTPTLGVATGTSLTLSSSLNEAQGADIASATTTDIGAATGNYINVTGSATITSLGTAPTGTRRIVTFKGAATLTYNATSLILPGAANITTAAEDAATFISLGSGNWKCVTYSLAAGTGGGGGGITSVATTGPITGGPITSTGTIGITQATTTTNGFLSSTDWNTFNGKQASGNYITALTGDITASGPGSAAATLATVATAGTTGSSSAIPVITIDAKGRTTSITTATVPIMFSTSFSSATNNTNFHYAIAGGGSVGPAASAAPVQMKFPVGFTITNMDVVYYGIGPNFTPATLTFALYVNGAPSTLTKTLTSTALNKNTQYTTSATSSVAVTAGSMLSVYCGPATASAFYVMITFYGYY